MNTLPERRAPPLGAPFRWDTPWEWPLAHQVGVLTVLVLVLLMACVASLWPWWDAMTAWQQSHQSLSAQYLANQQLLREVPDLEHQVQALRAAHERRQRDNAVGPFPWKLPVNWTPAAGPVGSNAAPRWRGHTQGQASELAPVLAQIATSDPALQVELVRTAQPGQWRLTWDVSAAEPPRGSRRDTTDIHDWLALLDDAPMRAHWRAQLLMQPGRVQWLQPQLQRTPEPLEAFELGQLVWIGWMQQGDRRVALVQAGTGVHWVAVGAHLGRQHGRVEQIGADHLVLREVLRNTQGEWGPVLTRWPALAPVASKGLTPSPEAKAPP